LFFWRDNIGNDADLMIERDGILQPVGFKSGATFHGEWLHVLGTPRT